MEDIGNYHNNYLKKDVLLLADVFEEFIDACVKLHRLDFCHYFIIQFYFFNIDKYFFIEKGLRGRISYTGKRYAKANNKYLNDYDPKKQSTFISYLDMNNLYGWAMREYLPYEGFKWLKNIHKFSVMSINDIFSNLTVNILINYMNYTIIIHNLQKHLLFLEICCQNIVKNLLINMR